MSLICLYCNKTFKTERNYEKHACETMRRHELLSTKEGRLAYYQFTVWRKLKGFSVSSPETFANSKYFNAFVRFNEFCDKKMIPEKTGFIKLMNSVNISPIFWASDFYHDYYMEKFNEVYTPMQQVINSLSYLERIAEDEDLTLNDTIAAIDHVDLIRLIAARKLSPWLLLFMSSFQHLLKYVLKGEEKILMDAIVPAKMWNAIFATDMKSVKEIKATLVNLGL